MHKKSVKTQAVDWILVMKEVCVETQTKEKKGTDQGKG
jgi:hypothetical protein